MTTFAKRFKRLLANSHFWTVVGGIVAILALGASAIQMYQAAHMQRETVEIDRRTMLADLAMRAHEEAYIFFTTAIESPVAKEIFAGAKAVPPTDDGDVSVVTPEVRSAYLRLEGAVARAMLNTDPEIVACLRGLEYNSGTLLESTFVQKLQFSSEDIFVALGGFPLVIQRYLNGDAPPSELAGMALDEIDGDQCEAFDGISLE